jgi:TrmH family RNA methyltransferase
MISTRDIERWFDSAHYRKKSDWVCIDQPKVIREWGRKGRIGQVICSDKIEKPAWTTTVPCLDVEHAWFNQVTKKPSHMGMMVIIERPTYKVSDLMRAPRVLLLDGIQDPGNLGTMMRSMVAFGCNALCLTDDCVDPFHPKSVNASCGAIAHLGIYFETHWMAWIKETKHPIYVLDPKGLSNIWDIERSKNYVLVCGSEGQGIQSTLIKSVHIHPISIPMADEMESINAALSVGIGLHQLSYPIK